MAVYYVTILTLTGLGYVLCEKQREKKKTVFYLAAAFLLLSFLASCRYAVGFDYFAYRDIYEMAAGGGLKELLHVYPYEPFFFILCWVFQCFGCPYEVFLVFINCFLIFTALWFIYQESKMPWVSVYLYITLQFLAYDMNLLRQAAAVSFFLLAYPYFKKRKFAPYAVLLSAGGLFHNSLFFMFPLYYFLPKKPARRMTALLSACAAAAYLFFDSLFVVLKPVLPEKYAVYETTYFWNSSTYDYVLFPALYAALIFLFRNRIKDAFLRAVSVNSAFYHFLISLFITKHFILERFAVYPFVFSLISIPEIIDACRVEGKGGGQAKAAYVCMALLFFVFGGAYFLFAAYKGFHHVYPYVSLFQRSGS